MDIVKHLEWTTPSIEINDGAFNVEITRGNVDILCEWDHGYGGRGSENCSIPLQILESLIEQYKISTTPQPTLSELLNDKENQKVVLGKIIEGLRGRGEWGRHGIFAKIAEPVGFSQSYVSKTLKGKMPLRENFVGKIAEYLGVSTSWLCGKLSGPEWENEIDKLRNALAYMVNNIGEPNSIETRDRFSAAKSLVPDSVLRDPNNARA